MSTFNVELKKVVDDSYEIEIGYELSSKLVSDIEKGLVGNIRKFAIITDRNVKNDYAKPIHEKLLRAGYEVDMFVFPAGEKSKTRETKANIEDAMLEKFSLRQAIIRLDEREATVIKLRYYHDLTQDRVAKVLGVSQVQISRIEKKALQHLRQLMA